MSKGEGKGQYHHNNHGKNGDCGICGCLFVMIILPPILIIVGCVMFFAVNNRVERINKYNDRMDNWINHDYSAFQNKKFSLLYQTLKYPFDPIDDKTGTSWPIRDECASKGDPEEGCKTTNGYMYRLSSISLDQDSIVIYENNTILINDSLTRYKYIYYSRSQLNCDNDDDYYCRQTCISRGGSWTGSQCQVKKYLTNVCYRIRFSGNSFETDKPSHYLEQGTSSIGCYYGDNYFSPYTYDSLNPETSIKLEIRLNTDPVVLASDLTYGCSDTYSHANNCFGLSKGQSRMTGGILFGVGLLLGALEVGIIVSICLCCKQTFKSKVNRYREPLVAVNYSTPANVPVSIPIAQPAYTARTANTYVPASNYSQPMY